MLYGVLASDDTVVLTDELHGKPVVDHPEPSYVPSGYVVSARWIDTGEMIVRSYGMDPEQGTAEEAALALSRLQFRSLPDAAAYQFRALADPHVPGTTYYGPDDPSGMPQSRVLWEGEFYKCLQTHVAQSDWNPSNAPSLWAKILPGQSGSGTDVGEWVRPDSTNGYSTGDRVTHNGRLWESIVNDNVDEPGTDNGFRWRDLGEVGA